MDKKNSEFYDSFARFYDGMINLEKSITGKKNALALYDFGSERGADIGCGSGADSIALAALGKRITGFDPSSEMVRQARLNAKKFGADTEFFEYGVSAIPGKFYGKFGFAVSLGNALANMDKSELGKGLGRINKILEPGGFFLLQILNYEKILREKERIVNITLHGEENYIRFYDFYDDKVKFNILRFSRDNTKDRELVTTEIFPYTPDELQDILSNSGFEIEDVYGSLAQEKFDVKRSPNLVIGARRK